MTKTILAAGLVAGALALGAGAAPADERGGAATWGYGLANELMSPYCPGRTLNDCPSTQATELKSWILAQEAAGKSQAEVEADLYARYGDVILQAPKATGFGLAAYVLPVLAVAAGAALMVVFLRRQGARAARAAALIAPAPGAAPAGSRAAASALEAELEAELEGRR